MIEEDEHPQDLVQPTDNLRFLKTEDVLRALGFKVDDNVLSDGGPGLSFDFGNFKLEASCNVNQWLRPVVVLGGVMTTTNRTNAVVHFEIPLELESFEQGIALVAYCLDSYSPNGRFEPALPAPWLIEGRKHRKLLPWNRSRNRRDSGSKGTGWGTAA